MSGTCYGYDAPRLLMYSPRSAAGGTHPGDCCKESEFPCPPGWCRARGSWEETPGRGGGATRAAVPWGYEVALPRRPPPPVDAAKRKALVKAALPKLQELAKAVAPNREGLRPDEEDLVERLGDWLGRLQFESLE